MRSAALALAIAGLLAGAATAAEPEPLDEDFLEYLAEFANDADDWTWFASDTDEDDEEAPQAASKSQQQAAKQVKP